MRQKLSQWHNGSIKPVHVGWYQKVSKNDKSVWYAHWNGHQFSGGFDFLARGVQHLNSRLNMCYGEYQISKWRGLAEKPD